MTAAVALLVGLCLGGCGSHTYTKTDFVSQANAICTGTVRSIRALGPSSNLAASVASLLPILQSERDQLRALPAPKQSAAQRELLARYLASVGQDLAAYRTLAAAARRGDAQASADAQASLRSSPTTTLAARYGLSGCASPGSTKV